MPFDCEERESFKGGISEEVELVSGEEEGGLRAPMVMVVTVVFTTVLLAREIESLWKRVEQRKKERKKVERQRRKEQETNERERERKKKQIEREREI